MEKIKEDNMIFKRKKLFCRALLLLVLLAAVTAAVLFALRPDLRFIVKHEFGRLSESAELIRVSEKNLNLESMYIDELEQNGCILNQSLMLVNSDNLLPEGFSADTQEYKSSGAVINRCALNAFEKLSEAVRDETGQNLYIMSSFRTAAEQEDILAQEGSDTAMAAGSSEHQTGLALDVYTDGFAGMGFLKSDAGQFVNSECGEYGFIIRYPLFKKKVTGIEYEPWHIRYVGLPHSEIISLEHETFEEYVEGLEIGKFYEYGGYIISRQQGELIRVPDGSEKTVSGDNCGGWIITVKK